MKSSFCGDGAAGGATGDGAAGVGGGGFSGDGDMSGVAPFVASASASFGAASESTDSEASSRVFASASVSRSACAKPAMQTGAENDPKMCGASEL